jgi:dolichol-phosphate mannosyltransferase
MNKVQNFDVSLVSVVFSFRNEEEVIDELIARLRKTFETAKLNFELIFVNDRSNDGSLELLSSYARIDNRIKIVNMSRRFGVSPCVLAGFEVSSGDVVVYLDTDLQDPPELIPTLVEKYKSEKADVVYTTRLSRDGENAFKMALTKVAYRVIGLFSSIEVPVDSGDFKLLSRRVVREILKMPEAELYLRGLVTWVGFKQVPVFYNREKRFAGEAKFSLFGSTGPSKMFVLGLISFSTGPLYLSLLAGFFVSGLSFLYLIAVILMKIIGWNLPGWSTIMAAILLLGGTQLIMIGIVGLYLGNIHYEVKRRPRYIVDSTVNL